MDRDRARVFYVVLIIVRIPHAINKQRTDKVVAKIHATKLTLDDAMGKNLPPNPGAEADKTLAGIDVNRNGIRDDVELAVFKEYPHSARTRSVLLQYALVSQMEMIQPIVNAETVGAVAEVGEGAYFCVGSILSRENMSDYIQRVGKLRSLVEKEQFNTTERQTAHNVFYEKLGSHALAQGSCDLDPNGFIN